MQQIDIFEIIWLAQKKNTICTHRMLMAKNKSKKRIRIRSKIPFPPTKIFADRKKEQRRKACREKTGEEYT